MTDKETIEFNDTRILQFYKDLRPDFALGDGVEIMHPHINVEALELTALFYHKFYHDSSSRQMIFGINPGRFGGGVTGIPFTDPIRLENDCEIPNGLKKSPELSSVFIYEMISAYGGAHKFYFDFFITALSPLGFTLNGRNLNYYDDRQLLLASEPFIIDCIQKQKNLFNDFDTCFCLGEGTNFKLFSKLNQQHRFFREIIPLPHPRWIMQYRRNKKAEYIDLYLSRLTRF